MFLTEFSNYIMWTTTSNFFFHVWGPFSTISRQSFSDFCANFHFYSSPRPAFFADCLLSLVLFSFLSTSDVIAKSIFGPSLLLVSRSQATDWTDFLTKHIRPCREDSGPCNFHIWFADFHWFLHKMNDESHLCNETIHLIFKISRIVSYTTNWNSMLSFKILMK